MSEVKLSTDGIRYIALFENLTGARAKDCFEDSENNRLVFVIKNGDMGLAIGKGGDHINRVKKAIGKHVEIIEYSDDPVEFVKNAFHPVSIKNVNIVVKDDKRIAYVEVLTKEKGLAIGRDGKNIEKVKKLSTRHHNIDDVVIQ
ncbi:MAG: NusA-like transcription termination signal-binding factor [Euryarchaeota archaeon]|nr:NusA-like transcription termination signal-binding factor [Euryarchaeota archaeon]MBU4221387.1 NusA-like transcription termination signal-binding factor [Euryarchaeota archaeon]MBU4340527.1 NusA-like transcription termination signal-binding factor [Euryarchaeota archaeon]MBU4454301.1 NusA-like transcription termination signal-binding factor [Euryarchaeota archaeon]MCG2736707.1 NusA-like transcription termination signal-binding factor [Candidatus Methanoperedenaceae archaeon]